MNQFYALIASCVSWLDLNVFQTCLDRHDVQLTCTQSGDFWCQPYTLHAQVRGATVSGSPCMQDSLNCRTLWDMWPVIVAELNRQQRVRMNLADTTNTVSVASQGRRGDEEN